MPGGSIVCRSPSSPPDAATSDLTLSALGEMTVAELRQAAADVLGIAWKLEERGSDRRYVAARLPEAERRRLPAELASSVSGTRGDAARVLGALSRSDQARLLDGDTLVRPVSELSAAARAYLQAMASRLNDDTTDLRSRRIDLADGAEWQVRIAPTPFQIPGNITFLVVLFRAGNPGRGSGVNVRVPDLVAQDPRGLRLPRTTTGAAEPVVAARVPPGFASRAKEWDAVLVELARGLKYSVVSDAYRGEVVNIVYHTPPVRPGETIEAFLDSTCRAWSRRWGHVNGVLTFQRVDGPLMRRAQIPETRARRWRRQIIETGRLTVEDLGEMAGLPPRQRSTLPGIILGQAELVVEHRDLLLLWHSLPASTRGRLTQGSLFLRDLPVAAQPCARAVVGAALGTREPLALANARLRAEQREETFTFSVSLPDRPAVERQVELRVRPDWVQRLKQEEEGRAAALRSAAGLAPTAS